MKRLIAFLLVLAAFAAVLPASAEESVLFIICNPKTYVCVRNSPKKGHNEGGQLDCGDYVLTDGVIKNGFVHVLGITENGDGWVHRGHLVPDPPVIETVKMMCSSNWDVICRRWVKGRKVGKLRTGDTVTVYARSEEWAVTNKGYVMTKYLEVDND